MKHLALAALLAALSLSVTAVEAAEAKKPAAAAKHATKKSSAAPKAAAKHKDAKPAPTKSKDAKAKDAKTKGKTPDPKAAAPAPAAEAPSETLTPEELEIAQKIYVGKIDCELGAHLLIAADEARPGFFNITSGKRTFYMHPVHSRTGVVRMEDGKHEAVYLQLVTKSMLMDQKAGQRMADECKSPAQTAYAAWIKDNPPPNFLLGEQPKAPPPETAPPPTPAPETAPQTTPQALPAPPQPASSEPLQAASPAPPQAALPTPPPQAPSPEPPRAVPLKDLPPLPSDAAPEKW